MDRPALATVAKKYAEWGERSIRNLYSSRIFGFFPGSGSALRKDDTPIPNEAAERFRLENEFAAEKNNLSDVIQESVTEGGSSPLTQEAIIHAEAFLAVCFNDEGLGED